MVADARGVLDGSSERTYEGLPQDLRMGNARTCHER